MNIHGYKQSHKSIIRILKKELSKPEKKQNSNRIRILREAKADCSRRIKELKRQRDEKKK